MVLRLTMWQDCKYCGVDFQDIKKRKYCDNCLVKSKEKPFSKSSSTMRMIRNREFIRNYKKDKKCVYCGYKNYPEILDFHHINKLEKLEGVSQLMKSLKSIYIIQKEIEKCKLLCPNCHREEHLLEKYGKTN